MAGKGPAMDLGTNSRQHTEDDEMSADEIDEKYSEADPDEITENAIDYFDGDPETESEKAADDHRAEG